MSGFSVDWLSLREPVDHRSVNADVRAAFMRDFGARDHVTLTDIGCGSGSHLRSLAPHLGPRQTWRLVDYDARLLAAARELLCRWADRAEDTSAGVRLEKNARIIETSFVQCDLSKDLDTILDEPADAVTAAAFFDLVSERFIETFIVALTARKLPLYTILTYDGREVWSPPHRADAAMLAAFNAHQSTDKGFGAAAGPNATALMSEAFRRKGYIVATGESPWRLSVKDRLLMSELASGIAHAVGETGRVAADDVASWLADKKTAVHCEIGHLDLYARAN